ncbi:hypothetical protein CkaCkLH20_05964 [Colletotrichum karsti]|uniref:Fe2OG dioxygenase domain-containing protein n=1 Tax=Colletotrichum karsti TaxID=1095194 RepID=A0A9P6LKV0_9PEZI|nr:uncharacterized protein CkaCkLH20_05964 [Colletotrichum karsti]KAF9876556.1 hypothetical protein CkaCkLH20_05964 [Colletotrichum karsti]
MPSVLLPPAAPTVRKRAPVVVGPTNKTPLRPTNKLPQDLIETARAAPKIDFDASKHVCFEPPKRTYTMEEWGYGDQGVSPIASSDPFPLFTPEAVQQVRRELFSEQVLDKCQFSSTFTKNQLRGYSREAAPFIHALWKSDEVRNAVSQVAGIDLVHAFEYEIGHINIIVNSDEDAGKAGGDNVGFSWHYDSFPFVCVTMLSDCSNMTGGETAVKKGDGEVLKVRGPTMGTAVILQGRYIQHAALKAFGKERISMITPFRPKSPFVRDELVLTGSRPISDQSMLMYDYTMYRAEVLEERFREVQRRLRRRMEAGKKFDVEDMREFHAEQKEMLEATLAEMIPIYDVV